VKDNQIPLTTPPISRFDYQVNAIGQRTGVQTTGSAFNSAPADWIWDYDALGQVKSADSPTAAFDRAYAYDSIGNRIEARDGVTAVVGGNPNYSANNLNQYSLAAGLTLPTTPPRPLTISTATFVSTAESTRTTSPANTSGMRKTALSVSSGFPMEPPSLATFTTPNPAAFQGARAFRPHLPPSTSTTAGTRLQNMLAQL
jgi:hypothetical protein